MEAAFVINPLFMGTEKKGAGRTMTLINQQTKESREFSEEHALRLLAQEEKRKFSSWALPDNAEHTFKNGNLIPRAGKRTDDRPKEQGGVKEGS